MEITLTTGKKVVLRERYPTREFDDLRKKLANLSADIPWLKRAILLKRFVESWEFEGDPQEPETWGDLDLFSEFTAIELAVADLIQKMVETAKNSGSKSTTL